LSQKRLIVTSFVVILCAILAIFLNSDYQKCVGKTTNFNSSKEITAFFKEWCRKK